MNYLHFEFTGGPPNSVEVTLDKQANIRLLDDSNFQSYKRGQQHTYYGGAARVSPVRIAIPRFGHWNVIIDLGGYSGTVNASIRII
jgi:hypothetical protein